MKRCYILHGDPIPLARPRRGLNKLWDAQKQLKLVVGLELQKQHANEKKFFGPLHLDAIFYFALASSWSKKKSQERLGANHSSPPDLSNCIKFIEDVAQGVLYDNDCTIASINAKKIYDENARVEFYICNLEND